MSDPKPKRKKIPKKTSAKPVRAELVEDSDSPANRDQWTTPADENWQTIDQGIPELESKTPSIKASSDSISPALVDPMNLYMAEVRKYPLLSREEEFHLAKKYFDEKDPQAAQALVTSNLRFVVKIASEYAKFGARLIDLVQEGNVGLLHAVREFNPYRGVRLITYAVWWIRGYIQEYLMKQYSLVKIGTTQNQKKLFYQLQKEKAALDSSTDPQNLALVSSKLGIPQDEIQAMAQRLRGRDVSLDAPVDEDSGSSLGDFRKSDSSSPEDQLLQEENLAQLRKAVEKLRPNLGEREKILLEERLLADEPLTLQEIGEKYGITREAIRQAEARLIKKIKETLESSTATPSAKNSGKKTHPV